MFGKKKKNTPPAPEPAAIEGSTKESKKKGEKRGGKTKEIIPSVEPPPSVKKKRKFFSVKMIFILLVLLAVGVSAAVVYKIYFTKKSDEKVYIKQDLQNIILAEEVIRFSYDFIPEVYNSMILFNNQIILLENEIKRLSALGEQFPDQIKISEKEMKSLEKEKTKLKQTYEKLEKRVESLYVSYRVNQETGIQQIEEQKKDIIESVNNALAPSLELTRRLTLPEEKIPDGFLKGTLYKIRKKVNTVIK